MPFSRRFPFYKFRSSNSKQQRVFIVESAQKAGQVAQAPIPSTSSTVLPPVDVHDSEDKVDQKDRPRMDAPTPLAVEPVPSVEHIETPGTIHTCHENGGPLAHDSWKHLMTGEQLVYVTTWNTLNTGKQTHLCGLCSILFDFTRVKSAKDDVEYTFVLEVRSMDESDFLDVHPVCTPRLRVKIQGKGRYQDYCLYAPEDSAATGYIATRPPCSTLSLEQACHLSLQRMNECLSNHTECPKPKPVVLPTRVIDCSDPSNPRLVVTAGMLSSYMALSYVWGPATAHITLKSNIDKYMSGIDPTSIPRTIRDAINVTYKLGQQYLWVDAFCIIQDSTEDKDNELVRMGQIYRDAHITIVASRSAHSDAGIPLDFIVPEYYDNHPKFCVCLEDGCLGEVAIFTAGRSDYAQEEPVDARGWCFQERFLSPRKLVYTSRFLEYQCQSDAVPVNNAIKWAPTETLNNIAFKLSDDDIHNVVSNWTPEDWGSIQMEWVKAVSNYTHRALSRPEDKLVAFAGIAEQFFRIWGKRAGRYVAGLWENHLVCDLLWYREPWEFIYSFGDARRETAWSRDPLRPRLSGYVAPSWSWASVQGHVRVEPPTVLTSPVCEILKCELTLRDERQLYGQVVFSTIRLRALVMVNPVILCFDEKKPISFHVYIPTEKLREQAGALAAPEDTIAIHDVADVDTEVDEERKRRKMTPILVRRDDVLAMSPLGISESRYFDVDATLLERQTYLLIRKFEGIVVTEAEAEGESDGDGRQYYRRIGYWRFMVGGDSEMSKKAPWLDSKTLNSCIVDLV
ncbi:hypothetical protein ONZ45_g2581 [Pleurotus djamor]|nr:hypothetical protein ONZ45_g2581 [Pleurotus djamor]